MTVYLYGSYASYVTAKTRCYLLKKGIPFVERLPGHPRFREHVRANTLLALQQSIPRLKQAGHEFVFVSEVVSLVPQ